MPNYNLENINVGDKWMVDAGTAQVIGVSSSGRDWQFTSNRNNPLTTIQSITILGTPATLTNPTLQATNSVNNYTQISIQNKSATANASADLIAYPDNVTSSDLTGFADVGITSSAYNQATYAVTGANEAYLFGSAPSGAGKTGNLVIATDSTGSANGIRFATGGFNSTGNFRMVIDANGMGVMGGASVLGYRVAISGVSTGGNVTQLTSRTTGVTLSKPTGNIVLFTAAGSATAASFTVTNTLVAATDTIIVNQRSGTNLYITQVTAVAAGSFVITFFTTGGTASDAPVFNFNVIKDVAS